MNFYSPEQIIALHLYNGFYDSIDEKKTLALRLAQAYISFQTGREMSGNVKMARINSFLYVDNKPNKDIFLGSIM